MDVVASLVSAVKEILENSESCLTLEELNVICDQMCHFIENSSRRREECKKAMANTDNNGEYDDLKKEELDEQFQAVWRMTLF